MKKIYPLLMVSVLLLSSCGVDKDQPENTQKATATLPTVIIPTDASKEAEFATEVNYTIMNYFNTGTWTVQVSNLSPSFSSSISFTSPRMSPTFSVKTGLQMSFLTPFVSNEGAAVDALSMIVSDTYNYYVDVAPSLGVFYFIDFKVGDEYKVKTFELNTYYAGNTVSSYTTEDGDKKSYTAAGPMFNIQMYSNLTKADLIIYNARFAEEMPEITRMVISGLKIVPDRLYGYRITGTAINPVVGTGAHATEYPAYQFTDIDFHPINDNLTEAQLTFKVGDRYSATFRGSCFKQ